MSQASPPASPVSPISPNVPSLPSSPHVPRAPLAPLTHEDPQEVGGFRLLARLGSGGMGTVYLARSAGGRTVALKTVHTRIAADTAVRTRFRLEADAARIIGDRYGARVFGSDALAATPWLAAEYLIGPQLDEAVRTGGPLPEPGVRSLGADLARALGLLHRSDVVHRDLKPSNIMITAAGPKVIDFGIARALGDERLTRIGAVAGTPAYMSPEQAGGLEHTPAGDVFALAGVLVFAASGHAPFGGGQAADLLYRVRYAEPDLSGVPVGLAPLLARCLDKDPARRPTTDELAQMLAPGDGLFEDGLPQPVLADIARRSALVWAEPPHRLPPPAAEPGAKGVSRRTLLTLGAAAVGGAALAGGGLWAWRANRAQDGSPDARTPLQPAPAPLWTRDIARAKEGAEPMSVGGLLFAVAGITAVGIDPRTGALRQDYRITQTWRVATDGTALYGLKEPDAPAPAALEVLLLPLESGKEPSPVVKLPAFDGTHVLNQLLCVDGGTAYLLAKSAAGETWFLVAANLRSGRELWRRPAPTPDEAFVTRDVPAVVRGMPVKGGLLLCRRADAGDTLALSLHDTAGGATRWQKSLPVPGAVPHRLAADEDHVYLGTATLQAVRLSDGAPAWSFGKDREQVKNLYGQRRYGIPTVRDGVVYAVEGVAGIVAVDARSGTERWAEPPVQDATPNGDIAPVVSAGHVYTMDSTGIRAVDIRTHRPVWRYETQADTLASDPGATRLYARDMTRLHAFRID
ncbi:protein kinase [Streptomyces sp. NPDC056492]|uniref:serine/threonine-protein kinase n=1 Tax=unclassified Streptomyces TaxID=2593676 RepID=UPI0036AA4E7A